MILINNHSSNFWAENSKRDTHLNLYYKMEATINLSKQKSLFDKLEWRYEQIVDSATLTVSLDVYLNECRIGKIYIPNISIYHTGTVTDAHYSFASNTGLIKNRNDSSLSVIKCGIEMEIKNIINAIKMNWMK